MGLVMEHEQAIDGYELVPFAAAGGPLLRRLTVRPSGRAAVYVHGPGDPFVPAEVAGWYTDRGFHFYAADLREVGGPWAGPPSSRGAAEDLGECFRLLDATVAHLHEVAETDTVVMAAHGTGALVAALWCHARRGSRPADALILVSPHLRGGGPRPRRGWAARVAPTRVHARAASGTPGGGAGTGGAAAAGWWLAPMVTGAQRRVRRGLDISCPVLVMCPASGWDAPGGAGGLLPRALFTGGRVTVRLGEHVTWLKLDDGVGGRPPPGTAAAAWQRQFFDELNRWLSAYLSGQIRDRLL
jgi:serine aminopeptidase S33 family